MSLVSPVVNLCNESRTTTRVCHWENYAIATQAGGLSHAPVTNFDLVPDEAVTDAADGEDVFGLAGILF